MKDQHWLQKFKEQKPKDVDAFLVANGIVNMDFRERLIEFQNFLNITNKEEYDVKHQKTK